VTHDLWVGDVGQDRYEEVDLVRKGENYGWNVYEAFERFSNKYERPNRTFTPPVFAYPHRVGVSVTGGYVYHGRRNPSFDGVYIFGDYQTQIIWGLTQTNRQLKTIRQLGLAPQKPVSFGCDNDGELFVVGYDGRIFRMHLENSFFQ
jgi:glucose/arabinose dehydrogenase